MKLINAEFDHTLIDDSLRNKKGYIRLAKTKYPDDPEAVDFEGAENALESLLGHAYHDERHYHPTKQGRRKQYRHKSMRVDWWDERPGGAGQYEWSNFRNRIYGLIDKYIGRKFDDCFTALKERYMTNKDWRRQACGIGNSRANRSTLWLGIRNYFLEIFDNHPTYPGDYYVDDDGLIQKLPAKPKHSNRDIHIVEGELYFVPNYGAIRLLSDKLADARVDISAINLPDKISWEFVRNWSRCFRTLSWYEVDRLEKACFTRVDNRTYRTIKWHTKEWYDIKGRSGKRHPKKPDNSAYYDRSLMVQKYMGKHKELGVTFHKFMTMDLADIRRDLFIEAANKLMANPYKLSIYGKATFVAAVKAVINSPWLDKACREPIFDADFQLEVAVYNYLNPNNKNTMTYKEQIQGRQKFNFEIADILKNHPDILVCGIARDFRMMAEKMPQQRAGQLICNYICGDYRDVEPAYPTKHILEVLFPGNPDPFFEESYETLKRLSQS